MPRAAGMSKGSLTMDCVSLGQAGSVQLHIR